MKKNKRLIIYTLLFVVLLGSTSFAVYYYFFKPEPEMIPQVQKIIDENRVNLNSNDNNSNNNIPNISITVNDEYISKIEDYRKEYNNNLIDGRLRIPALNIDEKVTRANDNKYYLNHNIYNQYDEFGQTFFDYRNTDLENARQINIYGHNTHIKKYYDRLPLVNLEAYTDELYFNTNKEIVLETRFSRKYYNIMAVKVITNADPEHMNLEYNNDSEWRNHLDKLLSNTLYIDSSLSVDDRFIVLQICHYNPWGSYLLVIAKEVNK